MSLSPGDDDDLHPRLRLPAGDRPDDVVRLDPLLLQDRDGKPPDDLLDVGDLGDQGVGRGLPRRLVVRRRLVAEGGPLDVEGDGDVVRLLVAQELHQHRREAVDRVGGKTLRVGELPDRVKGPEQVVAPVDEDEFGAFLFFCHQKSSDRPLTKCRATTPRCVDFEGPDRAKAQDVVDPRFPFDPRQGGVQRLFARGRSA